MKTIPNMTTDDLLEILQWVKCRRSYSIACHRRTSGEDAAMEDAVCAELGRRCSETPSLREAIFGMAS